MRRYRIVMAADPREGVVSPSWRVRESLLSAGHAVFWFTPGLWPELFDGLSLRLGCLDALCARWGVDAVLLADGVRVADADAHALPGVERVVLDGLTLSVASAKTWRLPPVADAALTRLSLANSIVAEAGEWPSEWAVEGSSTACAYALASADPVEAAADDPLAAFRASCREALLGEPQAVPTAFDDALAAALAGLLGPGAGTPGELRLAAVLGYVGFGNFGDECILETIANRLAERCPGTVTVAVCEQPWPVLVKRGIYAVPIASKPRLDQLLSRASVALVMAGLLFDQGIRWTCGKAEAASATRCSDLPGIASFCELASLNDVPTFFYGIGAGPLESSHSRALVRLMGRLGARFLCRDAATADLLLEAGLDASKVARRADVAFTASAHASPAAQAWLDANGLASKSYIVVSLRSYENAPAGLPALCAEACDAVAAEQPGLRFVFCVLDPADRPLADDFASRMPAGLALVFDPDGDVDAMADVICRARGGLSMRYHCSLLLARSGAPCAGFAYLPKVASLYDELGLSQDGLLLPMDADAASIEKALRAMLGHAPVDASALRDSALESEDELVQALLAARSAGERAKESRELFPYDAPSSEREAARLAQEASCLRARVAELETSTSYKLGRALTALPGKIKHRR